MIRFDKLTLKAQEAFQSAQDIAARHDQQQVEPLHLLGALVAQQDGYLNVGLHVDTGGRGGRPHRSADAVQEEAREPLTLSGDAGVVGIG